MRLPGGRPSPGCWWTSIGSRGPTYKLYAESFRSDEQLQQLIEAAQRLVRDAFAAGEILRPGDVLDLRVPLERVHMFDDASGLSLTSRQLVAA